MAGLTVQQLSRRVGVPPRRLAELMRVDAERGVVEQDSLGCWQLTAAAELEFGRPLRHIVPPATRGGGGARRTRGRNRSLRAGFAERGEW